MSEKRPTKAELAAQLRALQPGAWYAVAPERWPLDNLLSAVAMAKELVASR